MEGRERVWRGGVGQSIEQPGQDSHRTGQGRHDRTGEAKEEQRRQ